MGSVMGVLGSMAPVPAGVAIMDAWMVEVTGLGEH